MSIPVRRCEDGKIIGGRNESVVSRRIWRNYMQAQLDSVEDPAALRVKHAEFGWEWWPEGDVWRRDIGICPQCGEAGLQARMNQARDRFVLACRACGVEETVLSKIESFWAC